MKRIWRLSWEQMGRNLDGPGTNTYNTGNRGRSIGGGSAHLFLVGRGWHSVSFISENSKRFLQPRMDLLRSGWLSGFTQTLAYKRRLFATHNAAQTHRIRRVTGPRAHVFKINYWNRSYLTSYGVEQQSKLYVNTAKLLFEPCWSPVWPADLSAQWQGPHIRRTSCAAEEEALSSPKIACRRSTAAKAEVLWIWQ